MIRLGSQPGRLLQDPLPWIRAAIVFGVIAASLAVAYLGDELRILAVMAAIVGAGVVLVLLRWPELGLLLLLFTIAVPVNGPSNFNLTLVVAALILIMWLVSIAVHGQHKLRLYLLPGALPVLLLTGVAILSVLIGQLSWVREAPHAPMASQLGGVSLFLLSAVIFLVAAYRIPNLRFARLLVWVFLGMGAVAVFGWLTPRTVGVYIGKVFSGQAQGSMFWLWLVTIAFSQAVFNTDLKRRWRFALGVLTLATIFVRLSNLGWNSGWLPPLISICVILLMAMPRLTGPMLFMGIAALLWDRDKVWNSLMGVQKVQGGDNAYSWGTRLDAWVLTWKLILLNPVLGLGAANYYWYTPLLRIRGYAVRFNTHNQYVDLLAQTGFLGLGCYLWFFISMIRVALPMRKQAKSGFERAFVLGALGGVAGTLLAGMLGDWVIPFFYNITLGGFRASMLTWLFLGVLVAIYRLGKEQPAELAPAPIHPSDSIATQAAGRAP